MDTNENERIKALLTPKCKIKASADLSKRILDSIEEDAKHNIRILGFRISSRYAAVAAGFTAVICAAAAAVIYSDIIVPASGPPVTVADTIKHTEERPIPLLPLKYSNAPLSAILNDVAERYGCSVEYGAPEKKKVRLHLTIERDASLEEAVEILNRFDNFKITLSDNTIIVSTR